MEQDWIASNSQSGPKINLLSQATKFTHGLQDKGKDVHALALTDWVRGTEHLVGSRQYFLSFGLEGGKPILNVTSANGLQELKVTKNEIRDLQVSPRTLGALKASYAPPMDTRPRLLEHRRSS